MQKLVRILRDDLTYWAFGGLTGCVWLVGRVVWDGSFLRGGLPDSRLIVGALCGVFAVGIWLRQPWARWVGLVVVGATFGVVIWKTARGPTLLDGFVLVLVSLTAWYLWTLPIPPREEEDQKGDDKPLRSLVLLLREPRHLEAAILAHLASKAWGVEVEGVDPDQAEEDEEETDGAEGQGDAAGSEQRKSMIVGQSPHYLCTHGDSVFAIHHFDDPYVDDPGESARDIPEMRTRRAVEEHRAWLSVDLLLWGGEDDDCRQAYRLMGRLLAEVADENTLAVVEPAEGWIVVYDPETEAKLRSDDPLEALGSPYYPPVVDIEGDDESLAAGMAEARRRWPEFVAAFEQRQPEGDDKFSVKAPFTDGERTEFMWIDVTGIENDVIYGTLGNDPLDLHNVKLGDPVRASVGELNDWMCLVGGELTGGFTVPALAERWKQRGSEGDDDAE